MSIEILKRHRQVWFRKKVLRSLYLFWYEEIVGLCSNTGKILEIGGGGGHFKESCPQAISSDYTFCPWLDLNIDAHELPFKDASIGDIVMIDVLHHLNRPLQFVREAERVLKPGGRLIMLEPCITPGSSFVYRFLHQEDVDFSRDPFAGDMWDCGGEKEAFAGNMALPSQIFIRKEKEFAARFPGLHVMVRKYSDYLIYPLSGGFDHPSFIPEWGLPLCRFMEKIMHPAGALLAYRMLVVLEKKRP